MKSNTVTAAAVNPATFHLDCVDHLCRLEQSLTKVRSHAGEGPTDGKLRAIRGILACVSDFAEPRFSPPAFRQLADRIHTMYEQTKAVEKLLQSASWDSFKRLFGQGVQDSNAEVLTVYNHLQEEFRAFLVEYFVICVKRFRSAPEDKATFLESVDAFLTEVNRMWN